MLYYWTSIYLKATSLFLSLNSKIKKIRKMDNNDALALGSVYNSRPIMLKLERPEREEPE